MLLVYKRKIKDNIRIFQLAIYMNPKKKANNFPTTSHFSDCVCISLICLALPREVLK